MLENFTKCSANWDGGTLGALMGKHKYFALTMVVSSL